MSVRTSTRFRRERAAVPSARAFVRHALRSVGAPADAVDRLVLAVAEACNNAILHAGGRSFTISVVVEPARALVAVSDAGRGFVPPDEPVMPSPRATGRRGLAMMNALVDQLEVTSGDCGTTVMLVQSLVPEGAAIAMPVAAER